MSNQPFKKFIQQGDSGAKKKERIRQEKKQLRRETQEFFEKKKQEARLTRAQGGTDRTQGTRHNTQDSGYKEQGAKHREKGTTGYKLQGTRHSKQGTGKKESGIEERLDRKSKVPKTAAQLQTTNHKPQTFKPKAQETNKKVQKAATQTQTSGDSRGEAAMPLNKFIAHSGVCSRRDAADLVKAGKVTVNGEKITEPGHKVTGKDDIKVMGKKLSIRKNLVYILLNKPKDYITTTDDPQGRKTVLDIIKNATTERVYPVGRLDRNTTGVLLLTNDGELAQKLSHPSYQIKKIYEVKLDKPLTKKDFDTIVNGITLDDGFIAPDMLAYADPKDKSVIGIEIHSGRNRIVRRIFEQIGYDVRNLDRVMYANLTKKNVERGKWRFLTEKEVRLLKYLNASYTKNKTATRG